MGTAGTAGKNVFQADIGNNANQAAGICLQVAGGSGTLAARGNFFSNNANCSQAASVLTFSNNGCNNGNDLGLARSFFGNTNGNDIDVTQCSHP